MIAGTSCGLARSYQMHGTELRSDGGTEKDGVHDETHSLVQYNFDFVTALEDYFTQDSTVWAVNGGNLSKAFRSSIERSYQILY